MQENTSLSVDRSHLWNAESVFEVYSFLLRISFVCNYFLRCPPYSKLHLLSPSVGKELSTNYVDQPKWQPAHKNQFKPKFLSFKIGCDIKLFLTFTNKAVYSPVCSSRNHQVKYVSQQGSKLRSNDFDKGIEKAEILKLIVKYHFLWL